LSTPLKAKITISRFSGSSHGWMITIEDAISGTQCVDVRMSDQAFAQALGAQGYQSCELILRPKYVGMTREIRHVKIAWEGRYDDHAGRVAAMNPYEVDGWMGQPDDLRNHRNYDPVSHMYLVTMVRYVPRKRKEKS
jgi:hypothetical protein